MVLSDEAIKRPRAQDEAEERLEEVRSERAAVSETPKTLKSKTLFYESRSKEGDDARSFLLSSLAFSSSRE